jgi:hypothetical protein
LRLGVLPMVSMMSSSPLSGQPTLPMSLPVAQKAGHMPRPRGNLMRASMRPYRCPPSRRYLTSAR